MNELPRLDLAELIDGVAVHMSHRRIEIHQLAIQVIDGQAIQAGFKDVAILQFTLLQRLLHLHPFGDVAHDRQRMRFAAIDELRADDLDRESRTIFALVETARLGIVRPREPCR